VAAAGSAATSDSGQVLIADGRNVWFYDRDLQQVTVKPVDAALSATPIMLLSAAPKCARHSTSVIAGQKDGLSWLRIKPRGSEADFARPCWGLRALKLRQMILEDKLGQEATLTFSRSQRNASVTAAEVSFTPPKDVDVIGTPQK